MSIRGVSWEKLTAEQQARRMKGYERRAATSRKTLNGDALDNQFMAAYAAHAYKSEKTRDAAMKRDANTRARVVVSNPARWKPRKNDLAGYDDAIALKAIYKKRKVGEATPAQKEWRKRFIQLYGKGARAPPPLPKRRRA